MQKRKGYRREVWDHDATGLEPLRGYMKKRSRNGAWQRRYFFVNNCYLNYCDSPRKVNKIKASIDLRTLHGDPELVDRFGHLSLELEDDRVYMLKAETPSLAQKWVDVLTIRRDEAPALDSTTMMSARSSSRSSRGGLKEVSSGSVREEEDDEVVEFSADSALAGEEEAVRVVLEGTLQKRSPSRYKAWQARHFRLTSSAVLYYYKCATADLNGFLGQIPIDRTCSVSKCAQNERVFYLQTHFRVYTLQAETCEGLDAWIHAIQRTIDDDVPAPMAEENENGQVSEAELVREPPEWLKQWDLLSDVERFDYLQKRLDAKFLAAKSNHSMQETLVAATGLLEELDEVATECMFNCNRYDVLEMYLKVYHTHLEHEIGYFLFSGSFDDSSNQDMLRLMDLITAYDEYLQKVFQGEQGQQIRDRFPPITILDHVEEILGRYICDLQIALGSWADNIVNGVFEGLEHEEGVFDATASTHAPVDLFNMVNETLTLSKSSGLEKLEAAALSSCIVTIEEYVSSVLHRVEFIEPNTAGGLKFLCALLNDCGSIIEQIDNLAEEYQVLAKAYEFKFEPVMVLYDKAAKELIECIAKLIFDDISPLTAKLCTHAHFQPQDADIMETICATFHDYLNDLERVVETIYFRKLVTSIVHKLITDYANNILAPGRKVGLAVIKKLNGKYVWFLPALSSTRFEEEETNRLETDRQKITEIVHGRLFLSPRSSSKSKTPKLTAMEPLSHILCFLKVSLELFPQRVAEFCRKEDNVCVRTAIEATAFTCLAMRADTDKQAILDLASRLKRLRSSSYSADDSNSRALALEHPYALLWPAVFESDDLCGLRKDSKAAEPEKPRKPKLSFKAAASTVKLEMAFKASRDMRAVSKSMQARGGGGLGQGGKGKQEKSNEPSYMNLQGYMEKKSPAKNTWQRRWFILQRGFDDDAKQWKLMLSWHKTHSSKSAGMLYLSNVIEIKLGKNVPLAKTGEDGLYKAAGQGKAKAYPFMLTTENRIYHLRCFSVSETLLWVNSLTKAVKDANKQRTSSSATWKQLPIDALKALCRERKIPVPEEREELVQILQDNNFQEEVFKQEGHIQTLMRKGDSLLRESKRQAAEQVYDQAIRRCQRVGSIAFEARCLEGLGHCYTELPQKKGTSPLMFELAADMYEKVGMMAESKVCIQQAVDLYHENGDKALAQHCRQKSLSTTDRGGAPGFKSYDGDLHESIKPDMHWVIEQKATD